MGPYQFSLAEHGAAPCRCLDGPAVEALAADAVAEFHPRVVRIEDFIGPDSGEELKRATRTANIV